MAPLNLAPGINLLKGQVSSGFWDWNELSISWGTREDGELMSPGWTSRVSLDKAGRTSAVDLQALRLTLWSTFSVTPSLEQDLVGSYKRSLGSCFGPFWAENLSWWAGNMKPRYGEECYGALSKRNSCGFVSLGSHHLAFKNGFMCSAAQNWHIKAGSYKPWRKHICKRRHQWHVLQT